MATNDPKASSSDAQKKLRAVWDEVIGLRGEARDARD